MQAHRSRFHLPAGADRKQGWSTERAPSTALESREISVWRFFALTFLLGWGVAIIAILVEDRFEADLW